METDSAIRPDLGDLIALSRRAREFGLPTRRPSSATLAGQHASRFRGRGVDYLESRNYQPGDDIRTMDWRVTARTGRPHTKLFQEERERPVLLLVDAGPSMFFGTRVCFKSVLAARAAALIAWAATRSGDRIGALGFTADSHEELRPAGGRRGVLRVIDALRRWYATPPADARAANLRAACERVHRVARPGALVVILSDFLHLDNELEPVLANLRDHRDLVLARVSDPIEWTLPPAAAYPVSFAGTRGYLDLTRPRTRSAAELSLAKAHHACELLSRRLGLSLMELSTDRDPVDTLRRGLPALSRRGRSA